MNIFRQIAHFDSLPAYSTFNFGVAKEEKSYLIAPPMHFPIGGEVDYSLYISFMQQILQKVLPEDILYTLTHPSPPGAISKAFLQLQEMLPLIIWDIPEEAPSAVSFTLLCPAEFTHGVGRYTTDMMTRWLVPGKFLAVSSIHSLSFQFLANAKQNFFIHHMFLDVDDENDLASINNHFAALTKEIRLSILAVRHARGISSIKKLSSEEKKVLIQENLASVLDKGSKDADKNLFDQMHHFLLKLSAEEKMTKMKENFSLSQRPKIFDRDIFNEIRNLVLLFPDKFTAIRDMGHVSRLISFQYLFRKALQERVANQPNERHVSVKLLKVKLQSRSEQKVVIGVVGGMNALRKNELFDERHLLEAMQCSIKGIRKIKDSYISYRRDADKTHLFYIEIEKEDGTAFTLEEIKDLQKKLPKELKNHVESVIHPVFMPRNEEEVMRHIVVLSQQLKYVRDIPQVNLSFETQTERELSFTVVLLRLLKAKTPPLKELFQKAEGPLSFYDLEAKQVGFLRKRYPKEANVFTVKISKSPFLRKDYSVDLFKARQVVSAELYRIVGEMRDFNGGILSKQQEMFEQLKSALCITDQASDFLLENFFYSLTPPIMQSLLSPPVIKDLFLMMQEGLAHNFKDIPYLVTSSQSQDHFLLLIASRQGNFKDRVMERINKLSIPSSDLAHTALKTQDIFCLGFIFRCSDQRRQDAFLEAVQSVL